jgi:hypothetical protein
MVSASATIASVFRDKGWIVWEKDRIEREGLSFDFVTESETGAIFCQTIPIPSLADTVAHLTAQVAAVTRRRSVGIKAWEGYLLMLCDGDLAPYDRVIQSVQHDLSYCRKIVVSASALVDAPDPYAEATRVVSFLFPLELSGSLVPFDVRIALAEELVVEGVDPRVASSLVASFDESSCQCAAKLTSWQSVGES